MDAPQIEYWHWLVLGMILVAAEIFIPSTIVIWFGLGALVVGVLSLLVPTLPFSIELLLFGVLSASSLLLWMRREKRNPQKDEHPDLNQKTKQYIGQVVTLVTPIENGKGRAKVGDSSWIVLGPDLPEGSHVRIIGADGIKLLVEEVTD